MHFGTFSEPCTASSYVDRLGREGDEPARSQNAILSAQKYSCQCRFAISVRCAGANSSSVASTENELPTGVVSELQRECLLSELSFFLLPFHRAAAAQRKNVLLNVGLTSHQEN